MQRSILAWFYFRRVSLPLQLRYRTDVRQGVRPRPVVADALKQFVVGLERDTVALSSHRRYRGPAIQRTERVLLTTGSHVVTDRNAKFRMVKRRAFHADPVVAQGFQKRRQCRTLVDTEIQAVNVR